LGGQVWTAFGTGRGIGRGQGGIIE